MKVLITGASGFLGHYTVDALLSGSVRVLCVGRSLDKLRRLERWGAIIEQTDYSQESIERLMAGANAVVHLAARRVLRRDDRSDLKPFVEPNINLTDTLVRAALSTKVGDFVLASTIAVYSPRNAEPYNEDGMPLPETAYGLSKLIAEQYANMLAAKSSMRLTCLRFATLYGYGERDTPVLMQFIYKARAKEKLVIRSNPFISIDQLYVKDAVRAIAAALEPSHPGGIFNIGSGAVYTLIELAETVNSVFGNCGNLELAGIPEVAVPKPILDISRAEEILGWMPAYDLAKGLQDTLDNWGKIRQ